MKEIEFPPLPKAYEVNHPSNREPFGLFTAGQVVSYARAAVEADRAQRVPDASVSKELTRLADILRDCGRLVSSSGKAEDILRVAASMLASTPAPAPAPAQQELERALEPYMSRACLDAWDKSRFTSGSQDAVHPMFFEAFSAGFKAAQHQEPPQQERRLLKVSSIDVEAMIAACLPGGQSCDPQQVADEIRRYCNAWTPRQERKPMTEQEGLALAASLGWKIDFGGIGKDALELIAAVERHHGIKE